MKKVAPRNFNCPLTDDEDPCTNGCCTRDKCIPEIFRRAGWPAEGRRQNFNCPLTDHEDPCTNGSCTRDKCIPQRFEESRRAGWQPEEQRQQPPRLTIPPPPVSGESLAIKFDPSPQDVFKAALLKTKRATRTVHYQDGHIEDWPWNAAKFTEASDLMANVLTSRLRHWQRDRISWVEIRIIASDWPKGPNSIEAIPMPAPQPAHEKQRPPQESKQLEWCEQEKQRPPEESKCSKWWEQEEQRPPEESKWWWAFWRR